MAKSKQNMKKNNNKTIKRYRRKVKNKRKKTKRRQTTRKQTTKKLLKGGLVYRPTQPEPQVPITNHLQNIQLDDPKYFKIVHPNGDARSWVKIEKEEGNEQSFLVKYVNGIVNSDGSKDYNVIESARCYISGNEYNCGDKFQILEEETDQDIKTEIDNSIIRHYQNGPDIL